MSDTGDATPPLRSEPPQFSEQRTDEPGRLPRTHTPQFEPEPGGTTPEPQMPGSLPPSGGPGGDVPPLEPGMPGYAPPPLPAGDTWGPGDGRVTADQSYDPPSVAQPRLVVGRAAMLAALLAVVGLLWFSATRSSGSTTAPSGSTRVSSDGGTLMLQLSNGLYPLSQFKVADPDKCDSQHYHSQNVVFGLLDATSTTLVPNSDPDPTACGFGKVGQVPVVNVTLSDDQRKPLEGLLGAPVGH